MLLKYPGLALDLKKQIAPMYMVIGQELFLMSEAVVQIKQAWRSLYECDDKIIDIQKPTDWEACFQEANSYSLFAHSVLLDIRYEKKTFDATGKSAIQAYLNNQNQRCLVLIQANQIPLKQVQTIANHRDTRVIQISKLSPSELTNWITNELKRKHMRFDPAVPSLIQQYSQHNLLACAQVIEKLSLVRDPSPSLTIPMVREHLSDQCDYPLYDLADACLTGNHNKVLHMLRKAHQNRSEPTLILWLLSQEIRTLIRLQQLVRQHMSIHAACTQLKIWSHRMKSYGVAINKVSTKLLYQLLQHCQQIDEQIKTNKNNQIWQELEKLALAISGCKSSNIG